MCESIPLLLIPYEKPRPQVYVLGRSEDVAALGDLDNLDPALDCRAWPLDHRLPDDAWNVVVLWNPSLAPLLALPKYSPILLCRELEGVPREITGVPTVRVIFLGSSREALLQLLMCTVLSTSYQGPIGVDEADVRIMLEPGGIGRLFAHQAPTLARASKGLRRKTRRTLVAMGPTAAFSLTICAPVRPGSMRGFDNAMKTVFKPADFGEYLVVAFLASPQQHVKMWLLAIDRENL
ncbi:hypothetical protein RHOFW510R12_03950 [Rhodanobacter sp. FW510-R12]|uniref:hypothetical protein n=1 Tax=Rhodanobacter TaxID=75309 RepID=UPI000482FF63|nr:MULTISPECIES: hypothetical protein [Rhodanobacter]TAN14604.1 MAG: hypothetical protein EPN35_14895 [Rhodanobacter sp.]UJJ55211.1 hypothetical protein LRK53_02065 [Rhodanobacter thiooxydans]